MKHVKDSVKVALGITGGIAAYKVVEFMRVIQKRGFEVRVVMTRNAQHFVGCQTFQALTGYPVIGDMFTQNRPNDGMQHISLADWADVAVVAPASANIIGKCANGIADDFLSTFLMAFDKPILMAPAMNPTMYNNPAVQNNLAILSKRGIWFAGPESGKVACGHVGTGRMIDPVTIADLTGAMIGHNGDYSGRKMLITAGPTREMIDPVRYISNKSSGKMGYALAAAGLERGAEVCLVSGPVSLTPHAAARCIQVDSASDMMNAVEKEAKKADIIIMAAAVADWRSEKIYDHKWKKDSHSNTELRLTKTTDILKEIALKKQTGQIVIGFAAETSNLIAEGTRKLQEKNLNAIVVNDVSRSDSGFDSEANQGYWIDQNKIVTEIPLCSKREMADAILDFCVQLSKQ